MRKYHGKFEGNIKDGQAHRSELFPPVQCTLKEVLSKALSVDDVQRSSMCEEFQDSPNM